MSTRVLTSLSIVPLLFACAAPSTSAQSSLQTGVPERLMHDVAWLADDLREGRRAGTAKGLECADYIEKRMSALGLGQAGTAGFGQAFDVPLEARDGGNSSITAQSGTTRLAAGPDLVPLFCSDGTKVTGSIRFAAFGIDDADRGRQDFNGADFANAIVVVARGVPKMAPVMKKPADGPDSASKDGVPPVSPHDTAVVTKGDGWGGGGLIFTKVMNAKRKGAIGVILLPAPGDESAPVLQFGDGGSARAGIPCAMISWKGARQLFGSSVVDDWNADLAGAGIKRIPLDGSFTLTSDVVRARGPARNVLGKLRGTDSSRTIVVGAHYDHLGRGGEGSLAPGERGQIHNGADDNASGVAAVLEMARILVAGPRPACDVIFAAWSGEELGLLGSEYWCEHPTVPLANVAANLNLDMVGRADNGKLQVLAAGTAEPFASWMKDAGARAGLELIVSTSGNMMGGSSDHATFLKRKIPALHLFTGLHSDYHKPTDDTERFESRGAAKVVDLGVDLVRRMCAAGSLAFVEPKADPNEKPVKSGFSAWFGSIPNYAYDGGGVLIDGTSSGSPAEHAGFLKGDILLQVGDVKISGIYDFTFALQTYKPGDVVLVKFKRDGADQEMRVTLSTRGQQ